MNFTNNSSFGRAGGMIAAAKIEHARARSIEDESRPPRHQAKTCGRRAHRSVPNMRRPRPFRRQYPQGRFQLPWMRCKGERDRPCATPRRLHVQARDHEAHRRRQEATSHAEGLKTIRQRRRSNQGSEGGVALVAAQADHRGHAAMVIFAKQSSLYGPNPSDARHICPHAASTPRP